MSVFGSQKGKEIQSSINSLRGKIKEVKQNQRLFDQSSLSDLSNKKQQLLSSINHHNNKGEHPFEAKFLTRSLTQLAKKIDAIKVTPSHTHSSQHELTPVPISTSAQPEISTSNNSELTTLTDKVSFSRIQKSISSLQHKITSFNKLSEKNTLNSELVHQEVERVTDDLLSIILDADYVRSELTNKNKITSLNRELHSVSVSVKKLVDESKYSAFNAPENDSKKNVKLKWNEPLDARSQQSPSAPNKPRIKVNYKNHT